MSDALSRELCTPNVINPRVISDSHYAVVSQRLFHPVSCRKDRIPTQLPGSDHLVAKRLPPELLFALLDRHAAVVADSNVVPVVGEGHLDFHSISGRRSGEDLLQGIGVDYVEERRIDILSALKREAFSLILRKFERVNVFYFSYFVNYLINNVIDV
jgi:hypothetical protein|nr:hypothetical protein [Halorubrum lacusprofundi]